MTYLSVLLFFAHYRSEMYAHCNTWAIVSSCCCMVSFHKHTTFQLPVPTKTKLFPTAVIINAVMNIVLIVCAGTCVRLSLRQCFPSGVPGLIRRANSWAPDLLGQRLQRQSAVACVLFSGLSQWFWSTLELENHCSVQAHLSCASQMLHFLHIEGKTLCQQKDYNLLVLW